MQAQTGAGSVMRVSVSFSHSFVLCNELNGEQQQLRVYYNVL